MGQAFQPAIQRSSITTDTGSGLPIGKCQPLGVVRDHATTPFEDSGRATHLGDIFDETLEQDKLRQAGKPAPLE